MLNAMVSPSANRFMAVTRLVIPAWKSLLSSVLTVMILACAETAKMRRETRAEYLMHVFIMSPGQDQRRRRFLQKTEKVGRCLADLICFHSPILSKAIETSQAKKGCRRASWAS